MNQESKTTNEELEACNISEKVLDTPNRDPDDDLSLMSRQFQRKLEQRNYLIQVLQRLSRLGNEPMLGNSDGNIIAQEALKFIGVEP